MKRSATKLLLLLLVVPPALVACGSGNGSSSSGGGGTSSASSSSSGHGGASSSSSGSTSTSTSTSSSSGSACDIGVWTDAPGACPPGVPKVDITDMTQLASAARGQDAYGHIEINSGDNVIVDSCIIEKFGRCGPDGHQDHGVYLANGTNLVFRNNLIRGNASRGIQMYTNGGAYGTLKGLTIECNRIYQNGHDDYEDGFVINSSGTGDITDVTIQHNVIDHNFYSGIRFVGGLEKSIVVRKNTFDGNGAGSTSASRSEINIDSAGGGAGTTIDGNIFAVGNTLINDCYDGASLGFSIASNFVHGAIPTGAQGNCVGAETMGDPMFANAASGDYHPQATAAAAFGAYAP